MRVLGLIPARGGSKRVPGKNVRLLGGKPLIGWTIEAALKSGVCSELLVSTDDENIAKTANAWGASVPWLRPAELADDDTPSIDVLLHALDWIEQEKGEMDGVMLLQPTSPFRSAGNIADSVKVFSENNCHPVISFSPSNVVPEWVFRYSEEGFSPVLGWESIHKRSQDFAEGYELNGAIYIATPETLRRERTFFTPDLVPFFMMKGREAVDIDTEDDFLEAVRLVDKEGVIK